MPRKLHEDRSARNSKNFSRRNWRIRSPSSRAKRPASGRAFRSSSIGGAFLQKLKGSLPKHPPKQKFLHASSCWRSPSLPLLVYTWQNPRPWRYGKAVVRGSFRKSFQKRQQTPRLISDQSSSAVSPLPLFALFRPSRPTRSIF